MGTWRLDSEDDIQSVLVREIRETLWLAVIRYRYTPEECMFGFYLFRDLRLALSFRDDRLALISPSGW